MLKFKKLVWLFLICFAQASCAQNEFLFDEIALLEHVKVLSSDTYEGRKTGTEGSKKARKYIIEQFQKFGVTPLGISFEQNFNFYKRNTEYTGTNVLGAIKGILNPNKYIVISAHYDHLGIEKETIYNGADDNASGVGALIALAEYFKNNPPNHSVILAAFDAEELGLEGSKYYANNPIVTFDKLVLNINMDMISRSKNNELFMVKAKGNTPLNTALQRVKKSSEKIKLIFGHDGTDGLEDWTYASDHGSFYRKKMPFLYLGVADHKDYHEATDDYENIHPEFYQEAVHQIVLMFKKIDRLSF